MVPGPRSRISLPRAYLTRLPRGFGRLALNRGFRDPCGYLVGFPSPFRRLASHRGFRHQKPPKAPQEVGAGHPELLLRHGPRQPRQRRRHPRRVDRLAGGALRALLRAPGDEVARVRLSPRCLIAPPQFSPTLGPVTRALTIAHPRIRFEALPADHTSPSSRAHPSLFDDVVTPRAPGLLLASTPRPVLASASAPQWRQPPSLASRARS